MKKTLVLLFIVALSRLVVADAPGKPAALPAVPEALKSLKSASVFAQGPDKIVGLRISAEAPLTEEQLAAVDSIPFKYAALSGKGADDALLARVAKKPLEGLQLEHAEVSDEGTGAALAQLKGLKTLTFSHAEKLKGTTTSALLDHPALEAFVSDGKFGGVGMDSIATAKKLKSVRLWHGAANDTSVGALAKHPSLETLTLICSGSIAMTDASLASIATISGLKELSISHNSLTYEGGLKKLKELPKLTKLSLTEMILPEEDLAKLKAELPNVVVTFTPMSKEYRVRWDQMVARKK